MDAKKLSIIGIILLVLASAFFLFSPFDTNEEDNTDSTDLNTGFSGGSGTESDPYQISTCSELDDTRDDLDASYELVNDINFSECDSSYTTGDGWDPIDNFEETFDGNENTISDLYIDRISSNNIGLFGSVIEGGEVKNVGLLNVNITGNQYVGPLSGQAYKSKFKNSYSTGEVLANYSDTGGLVGYMHTEGETSEAQIIDSYSKVNVNQLEGDDVGGLVGDLYYGEIHKSYSKGKVEGIDDVGGLVGFTQGGTVNNSFWDVNTSGQDTSGGIGDGGTGKTTSEMQDIDTFTDTSTEGLDEPWDIVLKSNHDGEESTAVWFIGDGNDYPRLFYEYEESEDTTQKSNTISINSRLQLNDGRITLNG